MFEVRRGDVRYEVRTRPRRGHGRTVDVDVEKLIHEDPPNGWVLDGEHGGAWDGVSLTGLPHVPHDVKADVVRELVKGTR